MGDIYHLKIIVPVIGLVLLISSIVIGFSSFGYSELIEKYDDVKITYTVWESDESKDFDVLNPIFDSDIWVTIVPISENHTFGLILGLYNNLIGRELHYESGLVWLDKCVDQNRDGIDDLNENIALTYGNSSDLYFNTCLMMQFRVLEIQKGPRSKEFSFDWSGFIQFFQTISGILLFIFRIIYPILLLTMIILLTFIMDYLFRHQIKIKIDKGKLGNAFFKYGLMVGICTSIPFITFGIINLTITPEEFYLLKMRYDFFMDSIIFLIVLCCLTFIVSYLLLWRLKKQIDPDSLQW